MAGVCPCDDRSTPACAGKPCSGRSSTGLAQVYPRVCGEAELSSVLTSIKEGLPPRVRGSPNEAWIDDFTHGSTPACAGKP